MKSMRISHVFLVGALILGLFVAWNGALPKRLFGDDIKGGGCWICVDCDQAFCDDWPGAELCGTQQHRIECIELYWPTQPEYVPCSWFENVTPCLDYPECDFLACFTCP